LDLWKAANATPTATDNIESLRLYLHHSPSSFFLLADDDGRLAGSVMGAFDGWRGNIYRLAVHPDYRRQGLAHALVAEADRRLAKLGAVRVTALVESDHPDAVGFWTSSPYKLDPHMVRYTRDLTKR
jgi:ribosomal protein S18 acetylase RimI-like enzyme